MSMIDAHAHLSDKRLRSSWEDLAPKLQSLGLSHMVLGGVEPEEWTRQFELLSKLPGFITPVAGIHPWTVRDHSPEQLEGMFASLEDLVARVAAVGELGVDFSGANDPVQRMKQPEWADRQLDLATVNHKPVVLHVVRGHDVMHGLLKHYRGRPGIVHGWRGSSQDGIKYIDRAFVLGIGLRTIEKLKPADLSWIPLENFVLESDAPDLKGASDKPIEAKDWTTALKMVAQFMAKAQRVTPERIWAANRENLERILGMAL